MHGVNIRCAAHIYDVEWCNIGETSCFKDETFLMIRTRLKPLTPAGAVCYHRHVHPH